MNMHRACAWLIHACAWLFRSIRVEELSAVGTQGVESEFQVLRISILRAIFDPMFYVEEQQSLRRGVEVVLEISG